MKLNKVLSLAILGSVFFASCEKNLYDADYAPGKEVVITDLSVPADFDWKLSHKVACTINTQQPVSVSVYSDEACREELLATFTAEPNDEALVLSLPVSTQTLYVQYETLTGAKKTIPASVKADKTVIFELPADGKTPDKTQRIFTAGSDNSLFVYPANWGTILFEDMFPQIGDYDFNDFVAKYQIGLMSSDDQDKFLISNMRVSIYVYAIGGILNYNPYFRLVGIDKNNIDLSSVRIMEVRNNPTPGVEIDVVDSEYTNDLVIEYKNANNNPHKKVGSPYLNTEPGFMTKISETTQITIEFNFKNKIRIENLQEDAIDFFLANDDRSKEIHVKGYQPVFGTYEFGPGLHPENVYSTDKNLVWAMKIPATVRHINEKANFCKAYLRFADWVQSGGELYQDWYDRSNKENVNESLLVKWAQ